MLGPFGNVVDVVGEIVVVVGCGVVVVVGASVVEVVVNPGSPGDAGGSVQVSISAKPMLRVDELTWLTVNNTLVVTIGLKRMTTGDPSLFRAPVESMLPSENVIVPAVT